MFDISGPELLTILVIALIVVGPRRLPELTRRLGVWTSEIRRAVRELRTNLDDDVKAITEPIEQAQQDLTQPLKEAEEDLTSTIEEANADLEDQGTEEVTERFRWTGPTPTSGPTPEDAMDDLTEIEQKAEEEAS